MAVFMTRDQVKKKIKEKFGTYTLFTKYAGLDRYEFQKDFLTKNKPDQKLIDKISKKCDDIERPSKEFLKTIDRIKKAIDKKGGVTAFRKEHPEFLENTIFQMISGTYYKEMTPGIEKLMKALGVE